MANAHPQGTPPRSAARLAYLRTTPWVEGRNSPRPLTTNAHLKGTRPRERSGPYIPAAHSPSRRGETHLGQYRPMPTQRALDPGSAAGLGLAGLFPAPPNGKGGRPPELSRRAATRRRRPTPTGSRRPTGVSKNPRSATGLTNHALIPDRKDLYPGQPPGRGGSARALPLLGTLAEP